MHRIVPFKLVWLYLGLGLAPTGSAQMFEAKMSATAAAYHAGDWLTAESGFARLIADRPDAASSREAWFYLGEARTQLGNLEAAATAYRNFLLLVDGHPHREKARFRLAENAYLTNAPDAVAQAEGFLLAFPGSEWEPDVLVYLGQLRQQRSEFKLAERVFERALRRGPEHRLADEARLGLATARLALGEGEAAASLLEELSQRRNDGLGQRARVILALCELDRGQLAEAGRRLESVLASGMLCDRSAAEVRFWLARIRVSEQTDLAAAVELYRQALQADLPEPQLSAALTEWAALRLELGQAGQAAVELAQWRQGRVSNAWTRSLQELTLALQVRLEYEASRWTEAGLAAETYRVSHPAGPNYRIVSEIAGRVAFERGDLETAGRLFRELLLTPGAAPRELASYRYQLACQQVAGRQFAAALESLQTLDREQLAPEVAWQVERLEATALEALGLEAEALGKLVQLASRPAPKGSGGGRDLELQLLQLAVKRGDFTTVSGHWPRYRQLGAPGREEVELIDEIGDLAYRNRDWALATDCYRELAREIWDVETRAAGWAGIAWTALAEQRPEQAREAFELLLGLPVGEACKAEAYLPLGNLLDASGERAEANELYRRSIAHSGDGDVVAASRFKLAVGLHQTATRPAMLEAEQLLSLLEESPPGVVPEEQVAYRLAWLEEDLGRGESAHRRLVQFLDSYPQSLLLPDVVYRVAASEFRRGEFAVAESRLNALQSKALPAELSERVSFLRGQLAAQRAGWSDVLEHLEPLASGASDPNLRDKANYWLAEAAFQTGNYRRAAEIFGQLLEQVDPRLAPEHLAKAELRQVECLVAVEDWPAALAASNNPVRSGSGPEGVRLARDLLRGRALVALGRLPEAADCFGMVAAEATPQTELVAEAQWRLGEARLAAADYSGALTAYLAALAAGDFPKWGPPALFQAGKCAERLGNRGEALSRYRELIANYPTSELAEPARLRAGPLEGPDPSGSPTRN